MTEVFQSGGSGSQASRVFCAQPLSHERSRVREVPQLVRIATQVVELVGAAAIGDVFPAPRPQSAIRGREPHRQVFEQHALRRDGARPGERRYERGAVERSGGHHARQVGDRGRDVEVRGETAVHPVVDPRPRDDQRDRDGSFVRVALERQPMVAPLESVVAQEDEHGVVEHGGGERPLEPSDPAVDVHEGAVDAIPRRGQSLGALREQQRGVADDRWLVRDVPFVERRRSNGTAARTSWSRGPGTMLPCGANGA